MTKTRIEYPPGRVNADEDPQPNGVERAIDRLEEKETIEQLKREVKWAHEQKLKIEKESRNEP